MKLKTIPIETIDLEDERFRTSYFFHLDRLILSIQKAGLLSPPLLRRGEKGWVIVAGWKRILALLELQCSEIPAFESGAGEDLDCFLAALYENLATRELSLVEKSIALMRLEGLGVGKERLIRKFLPFLRLPATAAHLEIFLALARAEREIQKFVEEKNAPLAVVESLLRLSPAERKLVLPLLLPLGQNKQRAILEDLLEISRRDEKPVRQVLAESGVRTAAAMKSLSSLQKAELVRAELRRRRYPRFSAAMAAFAAAKEALSWPEAIRLEPSSYFEDASLMISFRCGSGEEFGRLVAELQKIAGKEALPALFQAGREG